MVKVLFCRERHTRRCGECMDSPNRRKSWAEGKVTELVTPSPQRVVPFCPHFGVCGGCKWQMLPYQQQLAYKQQQVTDQLTRIGHIEFPPLQTILGSPLERYYRNKLEFTFSNHRYRTNENPTRVPLAVPRLRRLSVLH